MYSQLAHDHVVCHVWHRRLIQFGHLDTDDAMDLYGSRIEESGKSEEGSNAMVEQAVPPGRRERRSVHWYSSDAATPTLLRSSAAICHRVDDDKLK